MRKKRILFCSEATFLNTGYATYTREILKYLHGTGKYEIAEMASYGMRDDPRAKDIPWKFYGVMPPENAPEEEKKIYSSNPVFQFGEFCFEHVCLDFFPDIVCDIRDFWMLDFEQRSPFRPFYNWVIMPTVDARPQARQWMATYDSADAVLTYSDWAGTVLTDQSGGSVKYHGSAPPSAHPAYAPVEDKRAHKQQWGLEPDCQIIGTVMRNQRRKLFPDLFEAFRLFLDKQTDGKKYYLYCHTSYPDLGWDIPELLLEHNIASSVLFTYICPETKKPFPSLFRGAVAQSPYTGKWGATLSNVKNGVSYEDLSNVINLFDLYTQYANCEGFGLPYVEAAACGIPVCGTDYSAMESEMRKLNGDMFKPAALYKELETGCLRAVPDNEYAADCFLHFFSDKVDREAKGKETRELFEKHFRWEVSGEQWASIFDSMPIRNSQETWGSAPRVQEPAPMPPEEQWKSAPASELTKWLIGNVLCEPDKHNTFFESRMMKDLTYRSATSSTGGMYYNESSAAFDGNQSRHPFDFNIAYNQMKNLCDRRNQWEQKRWQVVQQMQQGGQA